MPETSTLIIPLSVLGGVFLQVGLSKNDPTAKSLAALAFALVAGVILFDILVRCASGRTPALEDHVTLAENGTRSLDNQSLEQILTGYIQSICGEAGQIFRELTKFDYGIDGEIEFKDDLGRASGKRLYVQLKSGDSYLKKRRSDGAEVFQIKNPHWADYWQKQAYAVMLVIRTSDGVIRWMDVSAYLKRESAGGKVVKQIIFEGERFDAASVREWRKRMLG